MTTGSGNDWIDGDDGNDTINAGDGNNTVDGGKNNDTITTGAGNDTINGEDGTDTCTPGSGTNTVTNCESIITGGTLHVTKTAVGGNGTFDFTNAAAFSITTSGGTGTHDITGLATGTYSVDETADVAWVTSNGCQNISVTTGNTSNCTITNTKRGIIIIDKVTLPGADPQSFTFTPSYGTSFTLTDAQTPNTTLLLASGTYSVSEAAEAGWTQSSATCSDGSPVSAIALDPGETITCTFTNTKKGHIIVDKETDPALDLQSFDFTGEGSGYTGFSLTDAATPNDQEVVPGTYFVSEQTEEGWNQTSATCSDGSPVNAVVVGAGETVTCTFVNTKNGSITVHKETLPDGDTTSFDFTGEGSGLGTLGDFSLSDGDDESASVAPGNYEISEDTLPEGWVLTDIDCGVADTSLTEQGVSINVEAGEDVDCTFTNTKKATLTVIKETPNGAGTFDFAGAGYNSSSSVGFGEGYGFGLTTGSSSAASTSFDVLVDETGADFDLTEAQQTGWNLTGLECVYAGESEGITYSSSSSSISGQEIELYPGSQVTCTFTNTMSVCGNGIVQSGEACDDNNLTDADGCSSSCTIESGFACTGEPSVCTTDCGDGTVAGSEQCDDENNVDGDGCTASCQNEFCGDGVDNDGESEACDGGTSDTATCDYNGGDGEGSCTLAACGDGYTNEAAGEQCDDGNTDAEDGCSATCQNEIAATCNGLTATIVGTAGNDTINGTSGDDVIVGLGGKDKIDGKGGNDTICGNEGDDDLKGGDGTDTIFGDAGKDKIDGGKNEDTLHGGSENDDIKGGDNNDVLYGDAGNDKLDGGKNADTLYGGNDNDKMNGADGDDALYGENGNDEMNGGKDVDTLWGAAGNDKMDGGDGQDVLHGSSGSDAMSGGKGPDTLCGGADSDSLKGGDGDDRIDAGSASDTVKGDKNSDLCLNGETVASCEVFSGVIAECADEETVSSSSSSFSSSSESSSSSEASSSASLDYGDAPDDGDSEVTSLDVSYHYPTLNESNGANHVIVEGFTLGDDIDSEENGQPNLTATGDDGEGASEDDEDGVTFGTLEAGETSSVTVVTHLPGEIVPDFISSSSSSGESAYLNAWFDWNSDGDWNDEGEHTIDDMLLNAGTHNLNVEVPSDASIGDTFARFRWSSDSGLSDEGSASDGEVEDYKVTITGISACTPEDENLMAYFKFDEGEGSSVAADSSGNGNTATVTGSSDSSLVPVPPISFIDNRSRHFVAGSNGNFTAPDSSSLDLSGEGTVSFWFKLDNVGDQASVGKWDATSNNRSYFLQVFSDGKMYWNVSDNGTSHTYFMSSSTVTDTNWHNLVGTYDGSSLKVYLDGSLQAGSTVGVVPFSLFNSNAALKNFYDSANYNNGNLDDVRIYNIALSSDEIEDLSGGSCVEDTSDGGSSSSSSSSESVSSSSAASSSESSSSSEAPVIFGLSESGPGDNGNGASRGEGFHIFRSIAEKKAGRTAPGAFGGGSTPFSPQEIDYICSMQRALPADASTSLIRTVSVYMAGVMGRNASNIFLALTNVRLCTSISTSLLPSATAAATLPTVIPTDKHGMPVSQNLTWNACVRAIIGNASLTKNDIQSNPDVDKNGTPRSCAYYHPSTVAWNYPEFNGKYWITKFSFTYDATTKTYDLPAGYVLQVPGTVASK